jgi:NAD(P)-dependent dehydrogenase (short-subunit alcohol dehydrogenase family)
MELADKVVIVTGGASGIGRALAQRFAAEGARGIAVADRDGAGATTVAEAIGARAFAVTTDVSREDDVRTLVARTEERFGPIDLFCSNAGIATGGGVEASDEAWQQIWDINVMAHVYAARAVLPAMLARGEGYLLNTASATAACLVTAYGAEPIWLRRPAALAVLRR